MFIGLYRKQVLAFRKSNGNSLNTDKNKTLQSDSMSFSRLKCDQKVTLRGLNVIVMSVIYCRKILAPVLISTLLPSLSLDESKTERITMPSFFSLNTNESSRIQYREELFANVVHRRKITRAKFTLHTVHRNTYIFLQNCIMLNLN